MWESFPSNYEYFSCKRSSLLLLLEICQNYQKENISAGGSEEHGNTLFEFMQDRLGQTYLYWLW